jgi:hypothetical protein
MSETVDFLPVPSIARILSEISEAERYVNLLLRVSGIDEVIAQAQQTGLNMITRHTWQDGKLVVETIPHEDFYVQADECEA